ncbi:hypothetical protein G6046_02915, partial [Bacillus amyloliquefaciens]|nr:hypothetical protein [Bacillus amyloliquefaciens]
DTQPTAEAIAIQVWTLLDGQIPGCELARVRVYESDDLFADDDAAVTARPARPAHEVEARLQFYTGIAQTLMTGAWDGDRDTLDTPPAADA